MHVKSQYCTCIFSVINTVVNKINKILNFGNYNNTDSLNEYELESLFKSDEIIHPYEHDNKVITFNNCNNFKIIPFNNHINRHTNCSVFNINSYIPHSYTRLKTEESIDTTTDDLLNSSIDTNKELTIEEVDDVIETAYMSDGYSICSCEEYESEESDESDESDESYN